MTTIKRLILSAILAGIFLLGGVNAQAGEDSAVFCATAEDVTTALRALEADVADTSADDFDTFDDEFARLQTANRCKYVDEAHLVFVNDSLCESRGPNCFKTGEALLTDGDGNNLTPGYALAVESSTVSVDSETVEEVGSEYDLGG